MIASDHDFDLMLKVLAVMRSGSARGMTVKEVSARVVIERPPSRFVMPSAYGKRVIDSLRVAGYIERAGIRYKLRERTERPELPEGALYGNEAGTVVLTNVWGNNGRVRLIRDDLELWTYSYVVDPSNEQSIEAKAFATGLDLRWSRSSSMFEKPSVRVSGGLEHFVHLVEIARALSYSWGRL